MKPIYIISLFFLLLLQPSIKAQGWYDSFETYTTGTFPSPWTPDANATDLSTNYVTTSTSYNGAKSLQLHGVIAGCWAAIAYRPLTISPPFEVEMAVRTGNESLSGCHPERAGLGIRQGFNWLNPSREFILFKGNGNITSSAGNELQTYTTLTWYIIKVRYERPSPSQVRISYWINGVYKGEETLTPHSEEDQMTNLEIDSQEGTVWFDDVSISSIVTSVEDISNGPLLEDYQLFQNYPNPFNPSTTIRFAVKERSNVELVVFNQLGEKVITLVNEELDAGWYETHFNSSNLASGVYVYRIIANQFVQSCKMLLLK